MNINYNQVELSLQSKIENVYAICGDDFLAEDIVNKIKTKLNISSDFDVTKFDDENFSANDCVNSCNQMSFFNSKRMVIVKNLKSLSAQDVKTLSQYIEAPNSNSVLILQERENSNLFTSLKCLHIELKNTPISVIKNFALSFCKEFNKTIDSVALDMVVNNCLSNLNKIKLEIKKLSDYIGERQNITINDVNDVVCKDEEIIIFELTTALSKKDANKATNVLIKLMGGADQNAKLFGLVSSNFRRMFICSITKKPVSELAKDLQIKEYAVSKAIEQAKMFSPKKLKKICEIINDCDYSIKSGEMTQDNALYFMIMKILYI